VLRHPEDLKHIGLFKYPNYDTVMQFYNIPWLSNKTTLVYYWVFKMLAVKQLDFA